MKTPIDAQWYDDLRKVIRPVDETYILLEPTPGVIEEKRREFEASNFTKDISLFPEPEVGERLARPYENIKAFGEQVATEESNELVRETYGAFIDETLGNIRLIQAAASRDAAQYRYENERLHGMPDQALFADVCDWIRRDIEASLGGSDEVLTRTGYAALEYIPSVKGDRTRLLPSEATFQSVRALHVRPGGFYDFLFGEDGLPTASEITRAEGDEICQRVLDRLGARHAVVDAPNVTWGVTREPETLLRPKDYRLFREEFIGLVGHEIGSHILESINGAKKPLRLLEMGLAGFVQGNEGRALIREQVMYASVGEAFGRPAWEYAVMKFLAICLALGYHGRPYRFSEVYHVIHGLYAFWRERRMPGHEYNETFAREQAWFLTVRVLKGTDGLGGCYQKDVVYVEGNVALWRMAEKNPAIIMEGDAGKFNSLDPRHREIMQLLG